MKRVAVFAVVTVLLGTPATVWSQVPSVVPGWGIDTSGVASAWSDVERAQDVREIYLRWSRYLRSNPRHFAPTELWATEDQQRWPAFDLAASIAYQGVPATVLEITPVAADARDKYVVRTIFSAVTGTPSEVKPIAVTRVYAVRRGSGWVFTNVIADATRQWRRERVGSFTYVIEPEYPFDRRRAEQAVTFADSLADAFAVPRVSEVTYYLTSGREAVHRIMGVEWSVGGASVGYASPANRLIFSGEPAAGENYRHEIVHFVLQPLQQQGRPHALVNEGVATWLGGSMGRDFDTLTREYADYLRRHPEVSLDVVLDPGGPDRGTRPAGAILVLMIFESGGLDAVKDLLTSGNSEEQLKAAVSRLTACSWPEFARRWRERAIAAGA